MSAFSAGRTREVIIIIKSIFLTFSASQIWGKVWPILIAVFFFGLIIFIHELGHFITAKLSKIQVNEFAIGMGPTLFKFKKKETIYALRLLPIGGFVSMEGEDEDSDCDGAFNKKPIWKRMLVVAAGAIMNLLLGILILSIFLSLSPNLGSTTVSGFYENATSNQSGLQLGDEIISINGMSVLTNLDISVGMMRDSDGVMSFVVRREGEKVDLPEVKFSTQVIESRRVTTHDFTILPKEKNFGSVFVESCKWTYSVARLVWLSLFDIITGQYGLNELSGPVGTVAIVGESAAQSFQSRQNFQNLLMLMAFITINVGVFNLIPIPALDGGRLFFLLIELIIRKPLNRKYEGIVNTVGFILLLGFMALVTMGDIIKLIKG